MNTDCPGLKSDCPYNGLNNPRPVFHIYYLYKCADLENDVDVNFPLRHVRYDNINTEFKVASTTL